MIIHFNFRVNEFNIFKIKFVIIHKEYTLLLEKMMKKMRFLKIKKK